MRITVNGETREVADQLTIAELLEQLELGGRRVALEVNQEIVPRSEHTGFRLPPEARVEIVNAIGGG